MDATLSSNDSTPGALQLTKNVRGQLGLVYGDVPNQPGKVLVTLVSARSNAEGVGIRVGDILVAVNGQRCLQGTNYALDLVRFPIGTIIMLTLQRGSQTFDLQIAVGGANPPTHTPNGLAVTLTIVANVTTSTAMVTPTRYDVPPLPTKAIQIAVPTSVNLLWTLHQGNAKDRAE